MVTRALVATLVLSASSIPACSTNSNPAGETSDGGGANPGEPDSGTDPGHPVDQNDAGGGSDDGGNGGEILPDAGSVEPDAGELDDPHGGNTGTPAPAGKFFLPMDTPTNTAAPRIETDAKGGVHMLYPVYAIGDAFYGHCDGACSGTNDVDFVRLETEGSVTNAMLALDAAGHPRVLLSTFNRVYYASCDSNCTTAAGWTTTMIIDHGSEREVSGEALALEDGKPRFIMHAYRKFLGAFQRPETFYVTCDGDCHEPSSWNTSSISGQLWEGSSLRFDAEGTAHVATTVQVVNDDGSMSKIAAYFECAEDCTNGPSWIGYGLDNAYENPTAYPSIEPVTSLALTRTGAPRVVVLGKDDDGARISFHECERDCAKPESWAPFMRLTDPHFGAGLDLALDAADHPRLAFTSGYDIVLAACDDAHCTADDANWTFSSVEKASSMKPDGIILWPNCTVASWLLTGPSLAVTPGGAPRVGYQARDVSGGFGRPDPTKPSCTAGTDMAWTRLSVMTAAR